MDQVTTRPKSVRTFLVSAALFVVAVSINSESANALMQSSQSDELKFPYTAIVLADDTEVRSGPGDSHYATMNLSQNQTVQVYRHDPRGFCAIRPPADSFSLIPAAALRVVDKGVGEVLEDSTQVWVGTALGPVDHPLWQLKLKRGEAVRILGEVSWPNPDGHSTIWHQISPPAGEFRWVKVADLQHPPTVDTREITNQVQAFADIPITKISETWNQPSDSNIRQADLETNSSTGSNERARQVAFDQDIRLNGPQSNGGWKKASTPLPSLDSVRTASRSSGQTGSYGGGSSQRDSYQRDSYNRDSNQSNNGSSTYVGAFSSPNAQSKFGSRPIDDRRYESPMAGGRDYRGERFASRDSMSNQIQSLNRDQNSIDRLSTRGSDFDSLGDRRFSGSDRLARLEMDLNHEILKDPQTWQLVELKSKVEAVVELTTDSTERVDAQRLLEKVVRCERINGQYSGSAGLTRPVTSGAYNGGAYGAAGYGAGTNTGSGSRVANGIGSSSASFDASGWLSELVQAGGSLDPTYVLQDNTGRITHHITGVPGLNLHRYAKSKVGIVGRRGYNNRLNLNHVTAERVVVLQGR